MMLATLLVAAPPPPYGSSMWTGFVVAPLRWAKASLRRITSRQATRTRSRCTGNSRLAYEWLGEILLRRGAGFGGAAGLDALLDQGLLRRDAGDLRVRHDSHRQFEGGICSRRDPADSRKAVVFTAPANVRLSLPGAHAHCPRIIPAREVRRAFRCLPLLMLAWVNIHGSWAIGMGTIFVYWMGGLMEFQVGRIETQR